MCACRVHRASCIVPATTHAHAHVHAHVPVHAKKNSQAEPPPAVALLHDRHHVVGRQPAHPSLVTLALPPLPPSVQAPRVHALPGFRVQGSGFTVRARGFSVHG
eukprot:2716815-Rhodomonas_salina.1